MTEHTMVVHNNSYSNSTLKFDVAQRYQQQILELFEQTEIYLRSDISVDLLSKELGIPKHAFSQIFNVYLKKNFYSFVADYRILYAINKIELNRGILTLESLAYESGFNSRTSFNHYFKKHTGLTPNEYQLNNYKSAIA
ncbi:helix-turn-helix domain-containing protein [Pedobacter gandavensis]|uniref:helix-turn-helix domain-containing protein n=1 Tax=Pedobacter gandavensis TaxID=2679963 RepID=UPI00292D45C3|nr:helix-turn-helix domain-containing protein [Pedobacter gandavensis]